MRSIVK